MVPRLPTAVLSTGLMVVARLAITCGLVLDTVTRGRREIKRLAYLSHRPAGGEFERRQRALTGRSRAATGGIGEGNPAHQ